MKTDACIDIKDFETCSICIDEYELGYFDVFYICVYDSLMCVT